MDTKNYTSSISRIKRRNRTFDDLGMKSSGGMLDLFDNALKQVYRITDEEYDYLAENLNDNELPYFLNETPTFTEKRECLRIVEKHLIDYYTKLKN